MVEPIFSDKGRAFLNAWKLHDAAALRVSISADVERQNGRIFRPGVLALKVETDYLVHTMNEFATEININPVMLMQQLHKLRRYGLGYTKAIDSIIRDLGSE